MPRVFRNFGEAFRVLSDFGKGGGYLVISGHCVYSLVSEGPGYLSNSGKHSGALRYFGKRLGVLSDFGTLCVFMAVRGPRVLSNFGKVWGT